MSLRILIPLLSLLCASHGLLAQDVQARAQAMIAKARQLSDIRAKSAPAFRLSVAFSFVEKGLDTVQGTYTETWMSEYQWRRETNVGDLRHIEIGGPAKRWASFSDGFPTEATRLSFLMNVPPPLRAE